ncbi:hypothetical protein [Bradyrhizobium brasilense]
MLLTKSKKSMVGLEGFDLKIVGQKPIPGHRTCRSSTCRWDFDLGD